VIAEAGRRRGENGISRHVGKKRKQENRELFLRGKKKRLVMKKGKGGITLEEKKRKATTVAPSPLSQPIVRKEKRRESRKEEFLVESRKGKGWLRIKNS